MNSPGAAVLMLTLFTALTGLVALLVVRRLNWNWVQPHALHAAWLAGLLGIIPLLQRAFGIMDSPEGVVKTAGILLLHLAFFTLPFLWLPAPVRRLARRPYPALNPPRFSRLQHGVIVVGSLLLMAAAYAVMAHVDGFGLLNWLRYPRIGYQYYHRGAGVWYVLAMAMAVFLYLWSLFFLIPRRRAWVLGLWLVFTGLVYFTGAKKLTVAFAVQAVLAVHYLIGRMRFRELLVWAAAAAALFMLVFSLYDSGYRAYRSENEPPDWSAEAAETAVLPGSSRHGGTMPGNNVLKKILHYSTHYDDTRLFFNRFGDTLEIVWGRSYLEELWKVVPRPVVPSKPKIFGHLRYVVERMYPGCVETGHMPDVGGPAFRSGVDAYVNFGLAGVCLMALLRGLIAAFFLRRVCEAPDFAGYLGLSVCMGYPFLPSINGALAPLLWYLILLAALCLFHSLWRRVAASSARSE